MTEQLHIIIVPHTHWDREWYQTFQQFRMRLVHAIDRLLDILDRDPAFTHFMLDGQTIVLDDYLEVRPENAERLKNYIELPGHNTSFIEKEKRAFKSKPKNLSCAFWKRVDSVSDSVVLNCIQ